MALRANGISQAYRRMHFCRRKVIDMILGMGEYKPFRHFYHPFLSNSNSLEALNSKKNFLICLSANFIYSSFMSYPT